MNAQQYFSDLAHDYAAFRPGYPDEAVAFALHGLPSPVTAADIGCGTGIFTRVLARHVASVIGIDPSREMLAKARGAASNSPIAPIEYRLGTGEATGLADASIDVVACAQSFHWLDPLAALREFHRITRAGGRLALLWNIRDSNDPVTMEYNEVVRQSQEDAAARGIVVPPERAGDATLGGFFVHPRTQSFPNPQRLDLPGLLGRIRSTSYFPREGPLRRELEQHLTSLFTAHATSGSVTLQHRTQVTIADRNDQAR